VPVASALRFTVTAAPVGWQLSATVQVPNPGTKVLAPVLTLNTMGMTTVEFASAEVSQDGSTIWVSLPVPIPGIVQDAVNCSAVGTLAPKAIHMAPLNSAT